MKNIRKLMPLISLPAIVAPIATVISCGASQKPEEWHKQLFTPREVKIEVPDELFPGVKQDPIKFDEIKSKLLSFTESYDQDGNYILENDDVIFKFDKDSLSHSAIIDTYFAKEIFKMSMSQINLITSWTYNEDGVVSIKKRMVEFKVGNYSSGGSAGLATAIINLDSLNLNHPEESRLTKIANISSAVTHEFVHMQEQSLTFGNVDFDFDFWMNRFKREVVGFKEGLFNDWLNKITDDNEVSKSIMNLRKERFSNQQQLDQNEKTIRPVDFMGETSEYVMWSDSLLFNDTSFEWSVGQDLVFKTQALELEFFAFLNTTFTQNIPKGKLDDTYLKQVIAELVALPSTFNLNFFDNTKPRQAYDIMKPFIEEIYRVSKKPVIRFTGRSLFFDGVDFDKLEELDHYKVFFNGNEIIKHKFIKKDIAIGFNRNPFTPNEYKYVTKSISNNFYDTTIGRQLNLSADNTELKFYDINDNEIALDYDKK